MTRRGEQGFVLIATLWFIALLALVAAIIAGWMTGSLGAAAAFRDRIAARSQTVSAVNQVLYLMVANYATQRGLERLTGDELAAAADPFTIIHSSNTSYVALDDRPYRLGGAVVELQDSLGLYNLAYAGPDTLGAFLKLYGVPFLARGALIDRLLDYTEKSDAHRLNGAKAEQYQAAGRPPPREAPLLTPWEAYRVLGWDQVTALWSGKYPLPELAVTDGGAAINPNTAPAPVLETLPGIDAAAAAKVLAYRAKHLISSPVEFDLASGVTISDPMRLFYAPGAQIRLKVFSAKSPLMHELSLERTPSGSAPYRIDYDVVLPLGPDARAALKRADLPVFVGTEAAQTAPPPDLTSP